jgi:ABC-2 type transport system permease protein
MNIVLLITAKDLRQRIRDRSAFMFALGVPLGLTLIFNFIFGGLAEGDLGTIRVGVVVADDGELGPAFVEHILPSVATQLDLEVTEYPDADAARDATDAGDVDAAIVFPAGFSDAVQSGQAGNMLVFDNPDSGLRGDVVTAIADGFATRLTGTQLAVVTAMQAGVTGAELAELADLAASTIAPLELVSAQTPDEQLGWTTYLAAGMAVFFLFFTVQFGVTSYLEERTDGTLPRLFAAPIRRWQVMAAKALTSFVVGLVATATLLAAAVPLLGARWGNPLGVALLVVAAVLSATAIVGVVAALARNAEQAGVYQSVIAIVLGMLGGTFFPIVTGPGLLAKLSLLTPHAWFLRGLGTLSGGGEVAEILPAVGAMLAFGAVVGAIGVVLSRTVRMT